MLTRLATKAARRPAGFWETFNIWWRNFKDDKGQGPCLGDVTRWYQENSKTIWSDADRPSLDDTICHSHRVRSTGDVRRYHKAYRVAKRSCQEGAPDADTDCDLRATDQNIDGTGSPGGSKARRQRAAKKRAAPSPSRRSQGPRNDAASNRGISDDGSGDLDVYTCQGGGARANESGDVKSSACGGLQIPGATAATLAATGSAAKLTSQGPTASDQGLGEQARATRQKSQSAPCGPASAALRSAAVVDQGNPSTVSSEHLALETGRAAGGRLPSVLAQTQAVGSAAPEGSAAMPSAPTASRPITSVGIDVGKTLAPATACQRAAAQSPSRPASAAVVTKGADGPSPLGILDLNVGTGRYYSCCTSGSNSSGAGGTENVPLLHRREASVGSGDNRHCGGGSEQQLQPVGGVLGVRPPAQQQGEATHGPHALHIGHTPQDCVGLNPRPPLYPRIVQEQYRSVSMSSSAGSCCTHSDARGVRRSSVGNINNSACRPASSWGLMPPVAGFDPAVQPVAYGYYDPAHSYAAYGASHLYGVYGTDYCGVAAPGCTTYYQYNGVPTTEQPLGPWNLPASYYYAPRLPTAAPGLPPVQQSLASALPIQPPVQAQWQQQPGRSQYGTNGSQLAAMGGRPTMPSTALPGVRISLQASPTAVALSSRAPVAASRPAPAQTPVSSYNPNAYCRLPHRDYETFQDEQLDALYQSHVSSQEPLATTPDLDTDADLELAAAMLANAPNAPEPPQATVDARTVEATSTTWSLDCVDEHTAADAGAAWKVPEDLGDGTLQDMAAEFDRYLLYEWLVPQPQL